MKFHELIAQLEEGQIAIGEGLYGQSSGYKFYVIKAYGALRYYDKN